MTRAVKRPFYEFFAGGGMARAGLGGDWSCLFANDVDDRKAASYTANWGGEHFLLGDVAKVDVNDLPGAADLAWASFPCQDLSLAGWGAGINAKRSGSFWPFWRLMQGLVTQGRAPKLIVLENVYGALTSNNGQDFVAIGTALSDAGYRFGAVVMDAVHFIPQSRPRLFIVAVGKGLEIPSALNAPGPHALWHPGAIMSALSKLPQAIIEESIWWNIPAPGPRRYNFTDLIEAEPVGVRWHSPAETRNLLAMMSDRNRGKVEAAQRSGRRMVGGVYRRTRDGVQRAEVRFDDVSGCLRTPSGGSSRQTILIVEGDQIRSRLLSPREAARLMGLPDSYTIPANYNTAYHLAGDGLVVPVVRHLAASILEPILDANQDGAIGTEEKNAQATRASAG